MPLACAAGCGPDPPARPPRRRLLFGDFASDPSLDPSERPYRELPDASKAVAAVEAALGDHNAASRRQLPLAVFLFAVEHVARICRRGGLGGRRGEAGPQRSKLAG